MLLVLFVAPLVLLLIMSFRYDSLYITKTGFTFLANFAGIFTNPAYRTVARDTLMMATTAMLLQLAIAFPLAYFIAFKALALGAARPAAPCSRGRAQPDRAHLRLADAARPGRSHQQRSSVGRGRPAGPSSGCCSASSR